VGFWDQWCPFAVEVVAGRDGYAVEPVYVVGERFGCAGEMAVVEMNGEGFGYVVELRALAGGGCPRCIVSLQASLAPY
jgi:hypothetical protein